MPTRLSAGRSLELPQVDDSPGDARLTREALRHDQEVEHRLHLVKDGVEALAYPRGEGGFVTVSEAIESVWLRVVTFPTA